MASQHSAWGIEIGAYAVKAIRLDRNGDDVSVSDFAYIPHKKVLSSPDSDQREVIRLSLGQFISEKKLEGEHLVMSIPGHSSFARFAKLPPVEPKKGSRHRQVRGRPADSLPDRGGRVGLPDLRR